MSIAEIAIRRPVFITGLVILMLSLGTLSFLRLPVDQFPAVKIPYIMVMVIYPGAGPTEIANLIAKPLEDELRTISGVKKVMSFNNEGVCQVWIAFNLESDLADCEQQVRARVLLAKGRMPKGVEEPIIQRHDPLDQPVVTLAFQGPLPLDELFQIADRKLKSRFEQVDKVSQVKMYGGSDREIQVLLDRQKLADYELSVSQVGQALEMGGMNIPLGKRPDASQPNREYIYRSLGEFDSLEKVKSTVVKFLGNDIPTRIADLGRVLDTHQDETSTAFFDGQPAIIMEVYRQSGANTVGVADQILKEIKNLNQTFLPGELPGGQLKVIRDGARPIRANIEDVGESILIGIVLTVIVVFFFLGSLRSTLITGVAIPNSLIGAFVLLAAAGFSLNTLSLLGFSLAVGLLIDDAIVVRENIFRHMELGKPPEQAAIEGTREVLLAVIATTLAVLSVFGPIAFVGGITGKFLREFGLTVCFIMLISLFDALTMGPMLSAKFASTKESNFWLVRFWSGLIRPSTKMFDRFQTWLENRYEKIAGFSVKHPGKILLVSLVLVIASYFTLPLIPQAFLPSGDNGELLVSIEMTPGTTLAATKNKALEIEKIIRSNPEVKLTSLVAGSDIGDATVAQVYLILVPSRERALTTTEFKKRLREQLQAYSQYRLKINNFDILFGGQRPFVMNILSNDPELLEQSSQKILAAMRQYPGFVDADTSYRLGKPELRLRYDEVRSKQLGVSTSMAGSEVRAQIEGITPAKFREKGEEWDIRVRLQDSDRDLKKAFRQTLIPNLNYRLVNLDQVANLEAGTGLNTINRQDSQQLIWIDADIAKGYGVGDLMKWISREIKEKKLTPNGVRYYFEGEGEQFEEMSQNMGLAAFMAILFIYLVLASLYESFVTPFGLLLPLPLAVSGALVALWLAQESLNIYSIIAMIMLLGIATKNSILLIDYTNQLVKKGKSLAEALVEAGRTRLRPILMTSMALVAGTLPVAIGLNEAAKQRSSMGWVIIGGVISSTILSLLVVPATLSLFRGKKSIPATAVPVKQSFIRERKKKSGS